MFSGCQNWITTILQTFNRVSSGQNWLPKLLQAFNMLCGSQNGLIKPLQVFNNHCGGQNRVYTSSTIFSLVKMGLANFNGLFGSQKCFPRLLQSLVKAALLKLYRPSTGFAMVKIYSQNIWNPSTDPECVAPSSTGILKALSCQNLYNDLLQAFNRLQKLDC